METGDKLLHLLDHWIEHNEAHAQTYREWAEKAKSEGLGAVAEQLEDAIRAVGQANEALRRAERALGPGHHHPT